MASNTSERFVPQSQQQPQPKLPVQQHKNASPAVNVQQRGRPARTSHDKLWAEMQLKLEDIELSTTEPNSGVVPVLGHNNKALQELRIAQVRLAQAWRDNKEEDLGSGGGDDDDQEEDVDVKEDEEHEVGGKIKISNTVLTGSHSQSAATGVTGSRDRPQVPKVGKLEDGGLEIADGGYGSGAKKATALESRTQNVISVAHKRREANDHLFGKVSKGVLDVVNKLDVVASAMAGVEDANKDIWATNDTDSP